VAKTVQAYLAPDDPVRHLISDAMAVEVRQTAWMLRCLDVRTALLARGFLPEVEADVPLTLDDPQVPENQLAGTLHVAGGRGELVPGRVPESASRLSTNGLSALYAGTPASSLRSAGLLQGGGREHDALLDSVFAGRPAFLVDFF
jgi:predicted acetyltransferase